MGYLVIVFRYSPFAFITFYSNSTGLLHRPLYRTPKDPVKTRKSLQKALQPLKDLAVNPYKAL